MTLTRTQNKDLAELLHLFYNIEPTEMPQFMEQRWHPFLSSLSSDSDRAFALTAYFDLVNFKSSQLIIHLGQLSDEELDQYLPALKGFQELQKAFEAKVQAQA